MITAFSLGSHLRHLTWHGQGPGGFDPGGHTNRGVTYARHKEYEKAIAEFTKAIEAQPNDPKNYENRAMVYRLTGKPQQAIRDLRQNN